MYRGALACGNLICEVDLHPNPNLSLFRTLSSDKGNTHQTCVTDSDFPSQFPTTLSILGFLPNKKISSPPTLSRFHLATKVPTGVDTFCFPQILRTLYVWF